MVSRRAAVMMAVAAVADVVQPLPVDLSALDGDASEMPECSVSLLQTRMEKMRKSQVSVEAGDGVNSNSKVEGADQASKAMKEMNDAITSLFSPEMIKSGEPKDAEAIKKRASLQSAAIGKASHAIEDVKHAFSKMLAQEEVNIQAGKEKVKEMEKEKERETEREKEKERDQKKEKENKKADGASFAQQQSTRIGHTSTFNVEAASDFWDDADAIGAAGAQEGVSSKTSETSKENSDIGSDIDIWDDDWKAASSVGSLGVTQSATDSSYLSQSSYLQAALEGQRTDEKAKDEPKQKVVLSWGHDEEPTKNSLLSATAEGFPSLMSKEHKEDEDEESISSEKFETSDEQVVKTFIGGSVAQNSKSIQSILGDMMLSPDDQGMFDAPQEEKKAEGTDDQSKSDVQNQTSFATSDQNKSDVQNQTVLATSDQNRSDVRNKTSLAAVGSVIKSVITSVENSSWPWSKRTKPAENSGEVLAKDVSNSSDANKLETKTSTTDTVLERSNSTATKEDAAKASATDSVLERSNHTATKDELGSATNDTVLEKSNSTATKDVASKANNTALESSNETATQKDTAGGIKTNQTSDTKASVNVSSSSTDKK